MKQKDMELIEKMLWERRQDAGNDLGEAQEAFEEANRLCLEWKALCRMLNMTAKGENQ